MGSPVFPEHRLPRPYTCTLGKLCSFPNKSTSRLARQISRREPEDIIPPAVGNFFQCRGNPPITMMDSLNDHWPKGMCVRSNP